MRFTPYNLCVTTRLHCTLNALVFDTVDTDHNSTGNRSRSSRTPHPIRSGPIADRIMVGTCQNFLPQHRARLRHTPNTLSSAPPTLIAIRSAIGRGSTILYVRSDCNRCQPKVRLPTPQSMVLAK